jgi:hypothetical protein
MAAGNAGSDAGAHKSRFNRFMTRWLGSPFGVVSGGVSLIRYVGRVSGQQRSLPARCRKFEDGYLISVGHPIEKKWWRNFTAPWPIEVVRGPRTVRGVAVTVPGTTGRGQRIAADYFAAHRGAARRAGLPKLPKGEHHSTDAVQAAAATMLFVVITPDR